MSRVLLGLATGLLAASSAGSAIAADWGTPEPMFRPAYPVDMAPMEDSLDFEAGLRYFYGMGSQNANIGTLDYQAEDASHFLELHGRIEDHSTSTYVTANLGYAAIIDGEYETPTSGGTVSTDSGAIAYAGGDFGYLPVKSESFGFGGFLGYQYLNESLDIGRAEFIRSDGGGDSEQNMLEVHGLRLGVTAQAEINDVFDIRANVAAIPYASLSGTYGAFDAGDFPRTQGSAGSITGSLYGAAAEIMAGFQLSENIAVRAGAKGYYLTGDTETYYERRDADGANPQGYVLEGDIELMRWGPVVELTGTF